MDPKEVSRLLRSVQEKYKDKPIFTGDLCITDMARDSADAIDSLLARIEELEKRPTIGVDLAKVMDEQFANFKS